MSEEHNQHINRISSKIQHVGLTNLGNTCYMASILQLFLHCLPMIAFTVKRGEESAYESYLKDAGIQRLAEKERRKNKIHEDEQIVVKKQELLEFMQTSIIERFADIVNAMVTNGNSVIAPKNFKKILDFKCPSFRGYQQHDASELFGALIEHMFENETGKEVILEINNVPNVINEYVEYLSVVKKQVDETDSIEEKRAIISQLNEFKRANRHIINKYEGLETIVREFKTKYNPVIYNIKLFTITTKTCTVCNNSSTRCETTSLLQLYVVPPKLTNCLDQMVAVEDISGVDCVVCKCKRDVKSDVKIFRAPKTLFICLKRFKELPNGRKIKDDTNIEIPKILDLNPYMDHQMTTEKSLSNIYELKGISNHHGGLTAGHYTADCAGIVDPENWYHYNDDRVQKWEDPSNIDTSDAYVLMYEMKK